MMSSFSLLKSKIHDLFFSQLFAVDIALLLYKTNTNIKVNNLLIILGAVGIVLGYVLHVLANSLIAGVIGLFIPFVLVHRISEIEVGKNGSIC